jgi:signal transduction histidine kinase
VETVADGEAALAAARREAPDMILSDVMMPRLDGFGLLRAIRTDASLREVPVVLLSARAGEEARIEGLNAGADDYVVKPFSARELLARVGALLELVRTRRESDERERRELERASRQKDEFLAMLAHELRNPLAPIRNSSELLLRHLEPEASLRGAAHTIERQVTQLTRIVDDLLDISRITQGRIELRRRPVAVSDLVARALETVEPLMRRKGHTVTSVAPDRKSCVNADPERIVQCLDNLLTNAAKYTEPGGAIRIETREIDGEVRIAVSDNGVGISSDLLPKVFDLFVQAERTLDRAQGGLGIGLPLVKKLVEMHDGSVHIDSAGASFGTTCEIRLPLHDGELAAVHPASTASSRLQRILVVDDNEDAANTLAMILEMDGHEIATAHSGMEALDRVEAFRPDVVLLDIGLPGLDGYQIAQRIREDTRFQGIRLVALTGYGTSTDRRRAQEAGFSHHLVKPVDFADLKRTLDSLH